MDNQKIKIEWHPDATHHFLELIEYLNGESENAAFIVSNAILNTVGKLSANPTSHPLDRFKKNNDGNFRACMVYNYRISYYVNKDKIFILRIRHTSREPLEY